MPQTERESHTTGASCPQRREVFGRELEAGCGAVLLQVFEIGGARNRQHHRRLGEQPRERDLRAGRMQLPRDRLYLLLLDDLSRAERIPRQKSDAELFAGLEDLLGGTIAEVVFVLHRDDRTDLARLLELLE